MMAEFNQHFSSGIDRGKSSPDFYIGTIPFKEHADGLVYLPNELTSEDAAKAVRMVNFILKEYYDLND